MWRISVIKNYVNEFRIKINMQYQHAKFGQSRLDILLKKKSQNNQVADARNPKCSAEGNPDKNKPTHWETGKQTLKKWIDQNIDFLPAWKNFFETRRGR